MFRLVLLFLTCTLAMAQAVLCAEHRYAGDYKAYRALDADAQQQWLRTLVRDRMQPAAELALSGIDLQRQRQFATQVMQRAASGRTLSEEGVKTLLSRTDQLEKTAVEKLARLYRVAVYRAFHSDRREFELRMAAYRRVDDAFHDAGAGHHDRQLLIEWLQAAIERIGAGNVATLPAMPRFGVRATQLAQVTPRRSAPAERSIQPDTKNPQKVPAAPPTVDKTPVAVPSVAPRERMQPTLALPQPRAAAERPPAPHVVNRPVREPTSPTLEPPSASVSAAAPSTRTIAASKSMPEHGAGAPWTVQVDLEELAIRIAGYNLGIHGLLGRLQGDDLSLAELDDSVQELAELVARRGDLTLYCNLLPTQTRKQCTPLDSYAAAVSLLGRKISEARHNAVDNHLPTQTVDRRTVLSKLDALSRQLARLAATPAQ